MSPKQNYDPRTMYKWLPWVCPARKQQKKGKDRREVRSIREEKEKEKGAPLDLLRDDGIASDYPDLGKLVTEAIRTELGTKSYFGKVDYWLCFNCHALFLKEQTIISYINMFLGSIISKDYMYYSMLFILRLNFSRQVYMPLKKVSLFCFGVCVFFVGWRVRGRGGFSTNFSPSFCFEIFNFCFEIPRSLPPSFAAFCWFRALRLFANAQATQKTPVECEPCHPSLFRSLSRFLPLSL